MDRCHKRLFEHSHCRCKTSIYPCGHCQFRHEMTDMKYIPQEVIDIIVSYVPLLLTYNVCRGMRDSELQRLEEEEGRLSETYPDLPHVCRRLLLLGKTEKVYHLINTMYHKYNRAPRLLIAEISRMNDTTVSKKMIKVLMNDVLGIRSCCVYDYLGEVAIIEDNIDLYKDIETYVDYNMLDRDIRSSSNTTSKYTYRRHLTESCIHYAMIVISMIVWIIIIMIGIYTVRGIRSIFSTMS